MEFPLEINNFILSSVSFLTLISSRTTSTKWKKMVDDYFSSLPFVDGIQVHFKTKIIWNQESGFFFLNRIVINDTILRFKFEKKETTIPFSIPLLYRCKLLPRELMFNKVEYYPMKGVNATFVFEGINFDKIVVSCHSYSLRRNATTHQIVLMRNEILSYGSKRDKRFDEKFIFHKRFINNSEFELISSSVNDNPKKDFRWHFGEWL